MSPINTGELFCEQSGAQPKQPMIIFHDPRCMEFAQPGHPERPERIRGTVPLLRSRYADWEWRTPTAATEGLPLRAQSRVPPDRSRAATQDFDADTAALPVFYENTAGPAGDAVAV